ncbi:MAG: hypothetical protein ACYCY5_03900 [Sulfuricella sp.]
MQTFSSRSTFEDCLDAVAACDLFISLITPLYGSDIGALRGLR